MCPGPSHRIAALCSAGSTGILLGLPPGFSCFKLNVFSWGLSSPNLSSSTGQAVFHQEFHKHKVYAWPLKVFEFRVTALATHNVWSSGEKGSILAYVRLFKLHNYQRSGVNTIPFLNLCFNGNKILWELYIFMLDKYPWTKILHIFLRPAVP